MYHTKKHTPPAIQKKTNQKAPKYVLKEFDRAAITAAHFGFLPIITPTVTPKDIGSAKALRHEAELTPEREALYPTPEEKAALFRMYEEEGFQNLPHPLQIFLDRPYHGSTKRKREGTLQCEIDILGNSNAISEGLAMRTALSILAEEGFKDVTIDVNTMGDRESMSRFDRDMVAYIRKHINSMPADLRQAVKKDVFAILRSDDDKNQSLRDSAPKTLASLSEPAQAHFKEVLEYAESLGVPYKIENSLVGNKTFFSHTMFEIREDKDGKGALLAVGTRHDHISKKLGTRKDMSVLSITIACKSKAGRKIKQLPKSRFYFVQFGARARQKSLAILEELRQAKIPVYHSLSKDKLAPQLQIAENLKVSHLIIMGMKEAVEGTIVVRNAVTRAQETVPAGELVAYLKKIKV